MPQFRDFLARFRPAGSPGAAGRLAVAADRSRELAAELGPVLELLAPADAECARIAEEARTQARRIEQDAREQADAIAADAIRRAGEARVSAVREVLAAARAQAEREASHAARLLAQPPRDRERAVSELVAAAVAMVTAPPGQGQPP